MKKTVLGMLACSLTLGLCAQTPQQKTRSVIFEFSETWCGPCGNWGLPLANDLSTQLASSDKGYLLNIKTTSQPTSMNAVGGNALASNFNVQAVPSFLINKGSVEGTNASDIMNKVTAANGTAAVASAAANLSINGNTIKVSAKAKFWTAATGQYFMSVFITENDIEATQNGAATNPAKHPHVLRGAMAATGTALSTSPWGQQIGTATIAANAEFSKTFEAAVGAGWNSAKLEAYVVIFKQNNGLYEVVNAEKAKTQTTGIDKLEGVSQASIYPNPASQSATLSISATAQQHFDIHITDMLGRNIYTSKNNVLVQGQNSFTLPLGNIDAGFYNVVISGRNGRLIQRLSVVK